MKKLISLVFSVLASYTTFSQDISGNAGSATLWGGGISDLNNFLNGNLSTPGNLAALMGLESNTGYWKKISRVQVNAFLGIPADGETLQSVTDRGNTTYKKIVLAKDADQLRLQSSGLVNYTDILSGNDGFQITHGSSGTPALHIVHSNGNVGIGTTSPRNRLDILGDARSYEAAFGCFDAVTSCRGYANFGSNNHGSVLLSTNLL